jgi:hypothetical protein
MCKKLAVVAILLFASNSLLAVINDHFDNGVLDPAWQVTLGNASWWTYVETGSKLIVTDIGIQNSSLDSSVSLRRDFYAPGDYEIKSKLSWTESTDNTMEWIIVRAYSGNKIASEGGFCDYWVAHSGQKVARIEYPNYFIDTGTNTLPYSGNVEFTMKRTNGYVNCLWNGQSILTGYSSSVIDKIELFFWKSSYPTGTFDNVSIDYITAVPEPTTMILLGVGLVLFRKR